MSNATITKKLEELVSFWEKRSSRSSDCADLADSFALEKRYEESKARADAYADAAAQLKAIINEIKD